jgi:ABC-2 type transport system ATP-binding protein
MKPHAVRVRGLSKTYPGGVEALRSIHFDVLPGEVFGLLGPNGAGKSTTVGILTTTIAPTGGHAEVAGFDVSADPIAARRASAVVFQEPVVDRALSGRRNLEIARALVSEPQVLFLDEPTVGLDARIRHELLDLLSGLRTRSGLTTVLTTHYLDEAEQLCDRVAIMHEGRIVAMDRPAALLAGLGNEIVELRVDGDVSRAVSCLRAHGIAGEDAFAVGATLHVPLHDRPGSHVVSGITHLGLAVTAITSHAPTLDDVYLQLTRASLAA